jgi:hypothetical protein
VQNTCKEQQTNIIDAWANIFTKMCKMRAWMKKGTTAREGFSARILLADSFTKVIEALS